jgi:hypothetical protein
VINIRHDLKVRKSQHPIALASEPNIAIAIGRLAQKVLSTVGFDDELALQARKVSHVATNGLLAAERPAAQLAISQVTPQNPFS